MTAACGFSEGGTRVEVSAQVSPSAACAWSSARLSLLGLELVEAPSTGALRASHGAEPAMAWEIAQRIELVSREARTDPLATLAPPPGRYAALRVRWGAALDRGWPQLEASTASTTARLAGGAVTRELSLDAELGEDQEVTITTEGWSCPPAELSLFDPALVVTWR